MNYAEQQRHPGKHVAGMAAVAAMHVLLGYALMHGLARKVVEIVKAPPVEVTIVEEQVKPPPPPPPAPPSPPRPRVTAPPPPPFVPPPEVKVPLPPQPAPAIAAMPVVPTPAPPTPAPAPPVAASPAPAAPVTVEPKVDFATDCTLPVYPREARLEKATGETRLRVSVNAEGRVTDVLVLRSSGPTRAHKQMDRAIMASVRETCRFVPGTVDGKPQPLTRDITYVWKLVD